MRAVAMVVALSLLAGCRRAPPSAATPLAQALVAAAHELGGDGEDPRAAFAALDAIAGAVRALMKREPATPPAAALARTVFDTEGFAREVDDTDLRFVFLPSVLRTRRGSCVGLGTLALTVAERLGLEAHGVMMPGHFYVRIAEPGGARNVELLRRGEQMPDAWYQARYPVPGGGGTPAPARYGRPLSAAEVVGVVAFDVGNQRRRQGRLAEARAAFERATAAFPGFAEAHASLGATLHLLGALDQAAAAYQVARRIDPRLPGLTANLQLLDDERAAPPR